MTADDGKPAPAGEPGHYRVLARKYRPVTFEELIGQEALVRTLTNALTSGRLAQAYMLSGVRGVGKTTTARIVARALNCVGADGHGGITPHPCGVCEHCLAIAQDRHLDVIEMDAATHTGKEEMRELLDGVRYRPTMGRYKVYIIDEVHMLSEKAFNALLKTLEEPPGHVRFVFATTEIRKVPVTVLSRCQRFDLRRIDTARLVAHLTDICGREQAVVDAAAIKLIARAADGSVRDGLSLLDQALALAAGVPVDEAMVRDMLGLADRTTVFDILEAGLAGDAATALTLLSRQYEVGADPLTVLEDLLELTHWLTRLKVTPEAADAVDVPEAERERGRAMAGRLGMAEVTRAWQLLLKGLGEVRFAPSPIQAAEMVLIRLAYAARLPTPLETLQRLTSGEGTGAAPAPAPARVQTAEPSARPGGPPSSMPPRPSAPAAIGGSGPAGAPRRLTPAEAPATAPPDSQPDLSGFEDVVDLLHQEREAILHAHLLADVRLVRFEAGRIELQLLERAPRDLPQRLSRFLSEHTGSRWLVTVSAETGAAPLHEQRQAVETARLAAAAEHPLVRAVMAQFPGAKLEGVRTVLAPPDDAMNPIDPDEGME